VTVDGDRARSGAGGWFTDGGFATLAELAAAAEARLPRPVWEYVQGGASGEQTLRANRAAFERWEFRPRTIAGAPRPDTAIELLGERWELPVFVAPFGGDGALHPDGWHALARGSIRMGVPAMVPADPTPGQEAVARSVRPQALLAGQVIPGGSDADFLEWIVAVAEAGYRYVCVTDAPITGWREHMMVNAAALEEHGVKTPRRYDREWSPWGWERVARVCARSPVPWLVKGVLTAEDARAAVAAGASAVYVSNIGGRQLDCVPATLDQLPEVVEAVAGAVPVLVDGGVRRATDVIKALALGADAVGLGRLLALALAADGEEGVVRALQLVQAELVTSLALLGCGSLAELDRSVLQPARGA
jgi:4-hydroxymandelate oxidase